MIVDKLHSIYSFESAKEVFSNDEYRFDILHIQPKDHKFQLLITDGLSAYNQNSEWDDKIPSRIELYMCLPDYWNLKNLDWPIHWLNRIAQVPQKFTSSFGHGDTIPAGNPPGELDDKLEANHFIISLPNLLKKELSGKDWEEMDFKMLAVLPIFQTEVDFKLRNSATVLFKKMEKKQITELVDQYRSSVCRKRILGF
jgi:hypothetical protein